MWIRRRPPGGVWDMSEPAELARFLCPLLDGESQPNWFEHPLAGAWMDVAVYRLPDFMPNDDSLLIEAYAPRRRARRRRGLICPWHKTSSSSATHTAWRADS
jgi:hypothetical protein